MASKKLQITCDKLNLSVNINARYEKLDREDRPAVIAQSKTTGKVVKERTSYNGTLLMPGMTQRIWADDDGNTCAREDIVFLFEGEEVAEISQTKVMEITEFKPLASYTDEYVIEKYYELTPGDNDLTKDIDRNMAINKNTRELRKLWEYLTTNKQVARGEFNASSRGFMASDGYIRAVAFGNKWGLEIGVFKEAKVFQHLQEDVPQEMVKQPSAVKKLKRV
jgi:hypothetical protein